MNTFHSSNIIKSLLPYISKSNSIYIPLQLKGKVMKYINKKRVLTFDLPYIQQDDKSKSNQSKQQDTLLNYHLLHDESLVLIGTDSKRIVFYNQDSSIKNTYTHTKKITGTVLFYEDSLPYMLFSDKFGEVFLLKFPSDTDNEKVFKSYMIYGHAEITSFLLKSYNTVVSSDALGKIKICEYPNMFEIRSVILYHSYRFIQYLDDGKFLLVIDYDYKADIWELEKVVKVCEVKLEEDVRKVIVIGNEVFVVETKGKIRKFKFDPQVKQVFSVGTVDFDFNEKSFFFKNGNGIEDENLERYYLSQDEEELNIDKLNI